MGRLFAVLVAWAGLSQARAAEVMVLAPEGPPLPGAEVPLEIVIHEGPVPIAGTRPSIVADRGTVLPQIEEVSAGTWRTRFLAPATPGEVTFAVDVGEEGHTATLSVPAAPPPGLVIDTGAGGVAGQAEPVLIRVMGGGSTEPGTLGPDDVDVVVPEGRLGERRVEGNTILIEWFAGPEPFPRSVPVGARDRRVPDLPPAWAVMSLRARPRVPVRTEPGTRLTVRINRRSYGPFVAGADGVATAQVEVRPGEELAEVVLEDDLGNTQRSTLTLGGDPQPGLVMLAAGPQVAGESSPPIYLYAVAPDGQPWKGTTPACASSLGEVARSRSTAPGEWRISVPPPPADAFFDLRIDCHIEHRARESLRVPMLSAMPTRLLLRSFPTELSAELPRAQVQAYLENRNGDRLPAAGIVLSAAFGQVSIDDEAADLAALRAEYRGEAAVAVGTDVVRASWNRPPGAGAVWSLWVAARWGSEPQSLVVWGRALDQQGRPLQGVTVTMSAGGPPVSAVTNQRGWAKAAVAVPEPQFPTRLVLDAGTRTLQRAIFTGQDFGDDPAADDLTAFSNLTIRSGRVREVFLTTEPRTLIAGADRPARVLVRLVDKDGNPVVDEAVVLDASEGVVSGVRKRADGTYEATYVPPPGLPYGTVRITASSGSGRFAATTTELEIVGRELHRAPRLQAGYLVGRRGMSSPYLGVGADVKFPWGAQGLFARGSLGFYGARAEQRDAVTGESINMSIDLLPIGVGMLTRREVGRMALWVGSAFLVTPYRLEARFGDVVVARGVGLATPGFEPFLGVGRRLRNSELEVEGAWSFVSLESSDVGWQGPVGGAKLTVGYKLLY